MKSIFNLSWLLFTWLSVAGALDLSVANAGPAVRCPILARLVGDVSPPLSRQEQANLFRLSQLPVAELGNRLEQLSLDELSNLFGQVLDRFRVDSEKIAWELLPSQSEINARWPDAVNDPRMLDVYLAQAIAGLRDPLLEAIQKKPVAERKKQVSRFLNDLPGFRRSLRYHFGEIDNLIDILMGLKVSEITNQLAKQRSRSIQDKYGEEDTWHGALPEMLLTRYPDFKKILEILAPPSGSSFVDFGSGHGRMGLYLGIQHPELKFTGYELVQERVEDSQRAAKELGLSGDVQFLEQNLADPKFLPVEADYYYAFNPVSLPTFEKLARDLIVIAGKRPPGKPIRVIVTGPTRGKLDPKFFREIEFPGKGETSLKIYESMPPKKPWLRRLFGRP